MAKTTITSAGLWSEIAGQPQPGSPSAALQSLEVQIAPASQFTVYRFNSYTYV